MAIQTTVNTDNIRTEYLKSNSVQRNANKICDLLESHLQGSHL